MCISHKLNTAGSLFTSIFLHLPSKYLKIKITVEWGTAVKQALHK